MRTRRDDPMAHGAALLRTGFAAAGLLFAAQAIASDCAVVLARVVSVQGVVEWRRAPSMQWSAAAVNAELCPGDSLRVGERSRAALRLANDSNLRLDQNTTLTLDADEGRGSLIDLLRGAINIFTRTPQPFKVRTPFVNAGVEGTEFLVRVDADMAQVVVFEGTVSAASDRGTIVLASGEAAFVARDSTPRRERIVRPADAVQWALYYPSILGPGADEAPLREADALARRGRLSEAFARLDAVPNQARSARHAAYRAELLLLVGRVDEARAEIARTLSLDPRSSDAYALQAIIAVVQNDAAEALRLARTAVEFDPRSATARSALSYAEQARFDIAMALASAEEAAASAPDNALAWARAAELRMASGDLGAALAAAQRAASLEPGLSRAHTLLGFVHLTRIETADARQAFGRATALDASDPLPRLGLGLSRIRDGELAGGREEIEIAAGLDPLNSLVRSYLGKAYFDEGRSEQSGVQLDIAKQRDPLDPTPYLYEALRKHAANRPIEALWNLERSIELNGNRAVYRSRLLLDEDQAARTASVARIYEELGFDRVAVVEAVKSFVLDPTNHSSRWFLSDAFGQQDRQHIARASELLQAQLLQPVSSMPIAPQLSFGGLNLPPTVSSGTRPGYNEYSRLFERTGARGHLSVFAGNLDTAGDTAIASALLGRTSLSLGQFKYRTDGFRPNNDLRHDIYNLFAQTDPVPMLSLQAEYRERQTGNGDVALRGEPDVFDPTFRREYRNEIGRLGVRYSPSSSSDVLGSIFDGRLHDTQRFPGIDFGGCVADFSATNRNDGTQVEVQYLSRFTHGSIVAGASSYRIRSVTQLTFTDCIPNDEFRGTDRGHSVYVTGTFKLGDSLSAVLGVSRDRVRDANLTVGRWSPRFGLLAELGRWLTLRVTATESMKPGLFASQTLRPTHVLGFSHFSDDTNGSVARLRAVALDAKPRDDVYAGLEFARRETAFPLNVLDVPTFTRPVERSGTAYAYWAPRGQSVALSASYVRDTVTLPFDDALAGGLPSRLTSERVPLGFRLHSGSGWFGGATLHLVRQRLDLPALDVSGQRNSFSVIDATLAYRAARRAVLFGIDIRNALNRKFAYHDKSFLVAEPVMPAIVPHRSVVLRFSIDL